jgi:multiple sugar transport system substrate-binding protein
MKLPSPRAAGISGVVRLQLTQDGSLQHHALRHLQSSEHKARLAWVIALAGALTSGGCGEAANETVTLRFWAMGREGEVVQELVRDFERAHPAIRVRVQQIPWSAAHEKLLTAHVGESTPDLAQLGNSWIAEFAALRALEPLDPRIAASAAVGPEHDFPGIWETNVIDGVTYGVPWYVDTRVLFYRADLLRAAGWSRPPESWAEWRAAAEAVRGTDRFGILLPANEWTQPVILGMQAGSPLLADNATRGAFRTPEFRKAFEYYLGFFRERLAPPVGNQEIANVYQEFARGYFAMYITGPWNLGEFRRRLPDELQSAWETAPLPGPEGAAGGLSLPGGSSLVLFRGSRHKDAAWRLIEYLSAPEQQVRFFLLTGDLPARRAAWSDSALNADPKAAAFRIQLERLAVPPRIPEWELMATQILERSEAAIRGAMTIDQALAALDRDADRLLEKRRWLLERSQRRAAVP